MGREETGRTDQNTKKRKGRPALAAAMVICIGVMIFCAIQIFNILAEDQKGNSEYKELSQYGVSEEWANSYKAEKAETAGEPADELTAPDIDWDALKEKNPDVIGWITVPGTVINYPIVKGDDNDKYLHYTFENVKNANGSIFLDYRCSGELSDSLNVIYGHNMKRGAMFHDLEKFKEEKFFDEHREILIFTPEQAVRLKVVAAFAEDPKKVTFHFGQMEETEFTQYYEDYVTDQCDFALDMPEGTRQLYTFMTCSYEFGNARTFVQAVPWDIGAEY